MTSKTVKILGAAAAALMLVNRSVEPAAANPACQGLTLTTRQVCWDLREQVDEYFEHLRAAETRIGEPRWSNVYESLAEGSGRLVTYLSLQSGTCGKTDLDGSSEARAEYVLTRTFGMDETARVFDGLEGATLGIAVQALRTVDPATPIPWRELGAPYLAVTRTPAGHGGWDGFGLKLVPAIGAGRLHVWLRPIGGLPSDSGVAARSADADEIQVFRFRADLSSQR